MTTKEVLKKLQQLLKECKYYDKTSEVHLHFNDSTQLVIKGDLPLEPLRYIIPFFRTVDVGLSLNGIESRTFILCFVTLDDWLIIECGSYINAKGDYVREASRILGEQLWDIEEGCEVVGARGVWGKVNGEYTFKKE